MIKFQSLFPTIFISVLSTGNELTRHLYSLRITIDCFPRCCLDVTFLAIDKVRDFLKCNGDYHLISGKLVQVYRMLLEKNGVYSKMIDVDTVFSSECDWLFSNGL